MKQFDENLLPCTLVKIKSQCIWHAEPRVLAAAGIDSSAADQIVETYSYVLQGSQLAQKLNAFSGEKVEALVERYGGAGIGCNGGGGRTYNVAGAQIKGAGGNMLIGRGADDSHSHGTLNIADAVQEIINSLGIGAVLPRGVTACLALLYTGDDTAFEQDVIQNKIRPASGALLVRAAAMRPAHLLPAPNFSPDKICSIPSESWRIRGVMRGLEALFPQTNEFISFMGKILQAYADQFACARINRIAHGTLSASNLALDGRWLDLTNSSFVPGGQNVLLAGVNVPTSYEEHTAAWQIMAEVIYTYAKFRKKLFNVGVLKTYYFDQYRAYLKFHVTTILGIEAACFPELSRMPEYDSLSMFLLAQIERKSKVMHYFPEQIEKRDPVISAVLGLFLGMPDSDRCEGCGELLCSDMQAQIADGRYGEKLAEVIRRAYSFTKKRVSLKAYMFVTFATAVKRCLLPELFYIGATRKAVARAASDGDVSAYQNLLNRYQVLSSWFYEGWNEETICLLRTKRIRISFDAVGQNFTLHAGPVEHYFRSFEAALRASNSAGSDELASSGLGGYVDRLKFILKAVDEFRSVYETKEAVS